MWGFESRCCCWYEGKHERQTESSLHSFPIPHLSAASLNNMTPPCSSCSFLGEKKEKGFVWAVEFWDAADEQIKSIQHNFELVEHSTSAHKARKRVQVYTSEWICSHVESKFMFLNISWVPQIFPLNFGCFTSSLSFSYVLETFFKRKTGNWFHHTLHIDPTHFNMLALSVITSAAAVYGTELKLFHFDSQKFFAWQIKTFQLLGVFRFASRHSDTRQHGMSHKDVEKRKKILILKIKFSYFTDLLDAYTIRSRLSPLKYPSQPTRWRNVSTYSEPRKRNMRESCQLFLLSCAEWRKNERKKKFLHFRTYCFIASYMKGGDSVATEFSEKFEDEKTVEPKGWIFIKRIYRTIIKETFSTFFLSFPLILKSNTKLFLLEEAAGKCETWNRDEIEIKIPKFALLLFFTTSPGTF